jgi:Transposase IS116/IS110/IS902 family
VSKDRLDVVVLPEGWFFSVSNDTAQIAALVGLAPYDFDSGKLKGHRSIYGGRMMARSNLVGCSTGRSVGFAPRRILST